MTITPAHVRATTTATGLLAGLLLALAIPSAHAQVHQQGTVTTNNCVQWSANQYIEDAGGPCGLGTGNVSGPNSSTNNDLATWSGTNGRTLADSGTLLSSVVTLTGTQTLTNKSLTSPLVTGTLGLTSGLAVVNNSGASAPTVIGTTNVQVVGGVSSNSRIENNAYAGTPLFSCIRRDGSPATPTTIQSADLLCATNSFGYNGVATVGPTGSWDMTATANWTSSNQETEACVKATPPASTTFQVEGCFQNGLVLGAATGGEPGLGAINATGYYVNGTSIGSGPFLPLTGGTLTGTVGASGWSITTGGTQTIVNDRISGAISSAAWPGLGLQFTTVGSTLTDTTSSGTVTDVAVNGMVASTIAASSTTTYTSAATLEIFSQPTAGTNVTFSGSYALKLDGPVLLQGSGGSSRDLYANGTHTVSSNTNFPYILELFPTFQATGATQTSQVQGVLAGVNIGASNTQSISGSIVGVENEAISVTGATGTLSSMVASYNNCYNQSTTDTVTLCVGSEDLVSNSGTMTNAIGHYISRPTGAATSNVALQIGTSGTITTISGSYGIYDGSGYYDYLGTGVVVDTTTTEGAGTVNVLTGYYSNNNKISDSSGNLFGVAITATGLLTESGTSTPGTSAGAVYVSGIAAAPSEGTTNTGAVYLTATNGLTLQGASNSTYDVVLADNAGAVALGVVHGTTGVTLPGVATFSGLDVHTIGATLTSHASTATNGTLWNDSTQNSLGYYESGVVTYGSNVVYSAKAALTSTSATTAQTLLSATNVGTLTLPANFLVAGKVVRIKASGTMTTAASPGTLILAAALGGTNVAASASSTPTASLTNTWVDIEVDLTCYSTGSSGSVAGSGRLQYGLAVAGPTTTEVIPITATSATTINTTGSLAITLSQTNGTASGVLFTIYNATVETLS